MKSSLSVCLIVKNEALYLAECLQSVQTLAAKVIVVDTGSTDQSLQIARNFGAEIHQIPWQNHFAQARNAALSLVTTDWVLMLDADERLTNNSLPELQKIIDQSTNTATQVFVRICNLDDQGEIALVHFLPRLFQTRSFEYQGRIHEKLLRIGHGHSHDVYAPQIQILHLGYTQSAVSHKDKVSRNLVLIKQALTEDPTQATLWSYLGDCLSVHPDSSQITHALDAYQKSIELWQKQVLKNAHYQLTLSRCLKLMQQYASDQACLDFVETYLPVSNSHPDFMFLAGETYLKNSKPKQAKECYRNCLTLSENQNLIRVTHHQQTLKQGPLMRLLYLELICLRQGETQSAQAVKDIAEQLLGLNIRVINGILVLLSWAEAIYHLAQVTQPCPYVEIKPYFVQSPAEFGILAALQQRGLIDERALRNWIKTILPVTCNTGLLPQEQDLLWKSGDFRQFWWALTDLVLQVVLHKNAHSKKQLLNKLQTHQQTELAQQFQHYLELNLTCLLQQVKPKSMNPQN